MIEVDRLHYRYPGARALDAVSFALAAGSITALVGPNGAGKTTLLRCLAALDEPYSGHIHIDGVDVVDQPRRAHQRIGFLPDHFGLYAELSAERCLRHAGARHGLWGAALEARIAEVVAQVGLRDKIDALAGGLSRGQRQRLALAQAIIHKPAVLLLDEPASGLDPEARAGLSGLMRTLAAGGMTLLVSSHILAELEEYCTGMLVLHGGRVLEHRVLAQQSAAGDPLPRHWHLRLVEPHSADAVQAALPAGWSLLAAPENALTGVTLSSTAADADVPALLGKLLAAGLPVCEFSAVEYSLQDAYLATVREARA